MKHLWIVCLVFLAAGCGNGRDPLVAEVGPHRITAASLRNFVERLPLGLHSQQTGDAARREYLQSMIDRHLMLMEAQNLGLDTTRAVQRAVRLVVDLRVSALYRAREITPQAAVSEEEVRRFFKAENYDRERELSAILVKTRTEIEKVLEELEAGRPFEEVARSYSLDELSARQGGKLGFIGRSMAPRLHIPADVFASLPLGQVSPPLRAGQSWHVVRFTQERSAAYERYRSDIEERLFREQVRQVEEEHFERLKESFQVRVNPSGLQALVAAYRAEDPPALVSDTLLLYSGDSGELTLAAAHEALRRGNIRLEFADGAQTRAALERFVLRPWLMELAARRAGLYEEPEIRSLERSKREDVLLEALRRSLIAPRVVVSEAEAWEYYDNHPETFYHEDAVWAEELLLPTEAEAQQVKQQIAAGALFPDFAERSLRQGAKERQARFHFHPLEKGIYPRLVPFLMQASPGELVGPLEVEGGYSVFRVAGFEPGGIESYETAQRRAHAMLLRERESRELGIFVKELREKYVSQIKTYESRLKAALPDDLVGG